MKPARRSSWVSFSAGSSAASPTGMTAIGRGSAGTSLSSMARRSIPPAQPQADIEIIALGAEILDALGVLKSCEIQLNTLGDSESRQAYRTALVDYLSARKNGLSEDSRDRLVRNPLRILDSKNEGDRAILADAPVFDDYLNEASRAFFDSVRRGLDALGLAYVRNPLLVRGLDYYCHTAFEFVTTKLGAQGTVLGGGRYDGLMRDRKSVV